MSKLIQQRGKSDCFLACTAMAFGMSYNGLVSRVSSEVVARINEKGTEDKDGETVLAAIGLAKDIDYVRRHLSLNWGTVAFTKNMLWGRRALIQVRSKNIHDGMHMVYWDGKDLYDPSPNLTYDWQEVEPVTMWLFDEVNQ